MEKSEQQPNKPEIANQQKQPKKSLDQDGLQPASAGDSSDNKPSSAKQKPTPAQKKDKPSEPDRKKDKPKRSWIGLIALLLALCALIIAAFCFQQLRLLQQESSTLNSTLKSTTASSRQQADQARQLNETLSKQVSQLAQQATQQKQNVDEFQDRLTRSMQQVSKLSGNSRKDWLLAEVEYLLRLANQRVLMEQSPTGALTLLQSADSILKETDDVSIYHVRKALAKDVTALEAVPKLDVDGTFLKLTALNEQVDQLRLVPITDKHKLPGLLQEITPDNLSNSLKQDIKSTWGQALDKLGSLVVIQHRDEPIEPLLTPEQTYFLQQNLHLTLEQAQLSLLQGKQASYDTSLEKASRWIETYFEAKDSTTQALLKGLTELKAVDVSPPLPDISASLRQLKIYLAELHDRQGAS